MDRVIVEIKKLIDSAIKEYLPDEDLEENGTIYYMNGKNGTEFDYYVNDHLPAFMVFYNDKDRLGAAKLFLYKDGLSTLYLYNDNGKNLFKTIDKEFNVKEDDILKLAVLLTNQMDYKNWDASIEMIDTTKEPTNEEIENFKQEIKYFEKSKRIKDILHKNAYVSRKILDEGYKVGFMCREKTLNNNDSGWQFMAGNEDDEYINNSKNIVILKINDVHQMDSDILDYVDSPIGSSFIRISSKTFEEHHNDKPVNIEKRDN